MFTKKKKLRIQISAPSNFEHRVHTDFDQNEQKFAIVRGSKISVDGASLTWLLDEFETMSVTRSNSLRRVSPPSQPRRDSAPAGGLENGEAARPRPPGERGGEMQRPGQGGREDPDRKPSRTQQQPRGQEPSRNRDRPPPPPSRIEPSRRQDREGGNRHQSQPGEEDRVVRRDPGQERRPKSSYTGTSTSPQSPRDKRPLSGPNIGAPSLPGTDGEIKTAQPTARPFNTYPRAETDAGRGAGTQVMEFLEGGALTDIVTHTSRRLSDQLGLMIDSPPVLLPSYEEAVYGNQGNLAPPTRGPTQLLCVEGRLDPAHQPPDSLLGGLSNCCVETLPPPYEEVQSHSSRNEQRRAEFSQTFRVSTAIGKDV
ncbi:Serine/threonine-protein kinase PAK 4 [Acipenser ruthenus]|uniref:Serine/threonine-protein kinase PAK 4 n=1 Tax=Acipenser ruthenus TaxID=7906 RepID=A0A662YQJ6_ACIRT|nr:Serine/threonine-protein kinase PAK 4 [Acipenser ruthenus]